MRAKASRILALATVAVSLVSVGVLLFGGIDDPHDGPFWAAFLLLLWPLIVGPLFTFIAVVLAITERNQPRSRRLATIAVAVLGGILPWLPGIVVLKLWLPSEWALRDSSALVRRRGAERLSERSGPRVVAALATALRDPDDDVRLHAAAGLEKRGPEAEAAVPALLNAVDDPVYGVRGWSMGALARIPSAAPAVVPRVVRAMANEEDRDHAIDALLRIGPAAASAVPALRDALSDGQPHIRRRAARALGAIGPASLPAVPELRRLLSEEREAVRETARATLVALGENDGLPPSLVDDWPKEAFSPQAWQATPYWIDSDTRFDRQRYIFYRDLQQRRLLEGKTGAEIMSLLGPPHVDDRYRLLYFLKSATNELGATWWLEMPLDGSGRAQAVLLYPE